MKKHFLLIVILLTTITLITGCPEGDFLNPGPDPDPDPIPNPEVFGLKHFNSCQEVENFLEDSMESPNFLGEPVDAAPTAEGDGAANEAQDGASKSVEVEQADIVKYVGNRIYILNNQAGLLVYDVANPVNPKRLTQYKLDLNAVEIYVDGSQITVMGYSKVTYPDQPYPANDMAYPNYQEPSTTIQILDFSDPQSPTLVKEWKYPGTYSDSRKVGDSVYVVLQQYIWPNIIEDYVDESESNCKKTYAPLTMEEDIIYEVTSWHILGIDLKSPSDNEPKIIKLLGGDRSQMSASPDRLYLTNHSYNKDITEIFVFNLSSSDNSITPQAVGNVPGVIVNQFSMDEYAGHFRIATTTNRTTFGADDNRNYISVFNANAADFPLVGENGEITPGESITAARFMEDKAYLTTYVTKDPLLTVDMSDPKNPEVIGELDVPGYASHIHVWGDLLISIGSTEEFWGEVILTLFDISDISDPNQIEQLTIVDSYSSEAQHEHRAFSFFEDRGILAIPVSSWSASYYSSSEMKVYSVDESGFTYLGGIDHSDLIEGDSGYIPLLRRSLEIGAALYTISDAGIKANLFNGLEEIFGEMFPGFEPYNYDCYWEGCMMVE